MSITPLTVPPKKLAQTISASAMTFKMNNIEGWNGNDLTPADFGTEAFGVFINSTRTQIEIFSFDPATIADSEITILQRGLGYSGQLVEDAARKYPWASNDTTIQLGTDAPQLFRDFVSESNVQTITALHTYNVLPQSAQTPSNDEDFTTKAYVDGLTEPAITVRVNQVAHGLTAGQVIRVNGANLFTPAQADSASGSEVVGIVSEVTDVDNFRYITEGVFEDASAPAFAAGTVVFLSRTVAGELTDTDTTTVGEVSAPLGIVVENGAKMIFHRYRPAVINSIGGSPLASETIAGIVEEATQTQADNGDATGETGAKLIIPPNKMRNRKINDYVLAGGAADTYTIAPSPAITAYETGQQFTFEIPAAADSTGVSTLNVNGVGAITIKKNITDDIAAGDLVAGGIYKVVYDGTNFQLLTPTTVAGGGFTAPTVQTFTADGTWTKPAGCKYVRVKVQASGGGGAGRRNDVSTGGSAGAYTEGFVDVTGITSEAVVIGPAGLGTTGNGTNAGNASFGAHLVAGGGLGGSTSVSTQVNGGTVITPGNILALTGADATSWNEATTQAYVTIGAAPGYLGTPGKNFATGQCDTDQVQYAPNGYGGGGGGVYSCSQGSTRSGSNGQTGIVIVEEYYQ